MNEIDLEYEQGIRQDVANGRFVPWMPMLWQRYLSEEFILEFIKRFSIAHIFCYQELSTEAIEKIIHDNIMEGCDWGNLSYYQKLSEDFVDKYKFKLDWLLISCNKNLPLSFFRKFSNNLDWRHLGSYQKLSKKFIKEFSYKIYWNNIPTCIAYKEHERVW